MNLEDLSPEQQAKILASEIDYKLFMARYKKAHECCPKCGAIPYSSTLAAFIMHSDNRAAYKDLNHCECVACGDKHVYHDRVPKQSTIKHIEGDLVRDAEQYDILLHGCNCQNTMGKGIALQIREKFPQAYEVDSKTKKGDKSKLGTISFTNTTPIIVNCYTQFDYRKQYEDEALVFVDYNAVKSALQLVKKHFTGKKIGMPHIGAQLAGGDWNIILRIIEDVFEGENVTVVKYKP